MSAIVAALALVAQVATAKAEDLAHKPVHVRIGVGVESRLLLPDALVRVNGSRSAGELLGLKLGQARPQTLLLFRPREAGGATFTYVGTRYTMRLAVEASVLASALDGELRVEDNVPDEDEDAAAQAPGKSALAPDAPSSQASKNLSLATGPQTLGPSSLAHDSDRAGRGAAQTPGFPTLASDPAAGRAQASKNLSLATGPQTLGSSSLAHDSDRSGRGAAQTPGFPTLAPDPAAGRAQASKNLSLATGPQTLGSSPVAHDSDSAGRGAAQPPGFPTLASDLGAARAQASKTLSLATDPQTLGSSSLAHDSDSAGRGAAQPPGSSSLAPDPAAGRAQASKNLSLATGPPSGGDAAQTPERRALALTPPAPALDGGTPPPPPRLAVTLRPRHRIGRPGQRGVVLEEVSREHGRLVLHLRVERGARLDVAGLEVDGVPAALTTHAAQGDLVIVATLPDRAQPPRLASLVLNQRDRWTRTVLPLHALQGALS